MTEPVAEPFGSESEPESPAVPAPEPEPEAAAEPAAQDEPAPDAVPAEDVSEPGPADHVPAPFIPDTGVSSWLRDALAELHRRIANLGG